MAAPSCLLRAEHRRPSWERFATRFVANSTVRGVARTGTYSRTVLFSVTEGGLTVAEASAV
jgi:hypothetical protein